MEDLFATVELDAREYGLVVTPLAEVDALPRMVEARLST